MALINKLIKFMDAHLKKDNLAESLEKFETFEDFQRTRTVMKCAINDYISKFDQLYNKIENFSDLYQCRPASPCLHIMYL